MNAITLTYVLSVIAAVLVGRLISFIQQKYFRDKETQFMDFEILTRIPLFLLFFVSAAFGIMTPAISLGAVQIASFSPAVLLTYPVAIFLGLANQRYGVLKPFDPKKLDREGALGLVLLYATAGLTLGTLILLPAGGLLAQVPAAAAGIAYLFGVVLLFKALSRLFG